MRLLVTAITGLLNAPQRVFSDRMSSIILRESTDYFKTSSDDELKNAKYFNNFDKLVK